MRDYVVILIIDQQVVIYGPYDEITCQKKTGFMKVQYASYETCAVFNLRQDHAKVLFNPMRVLEIPPEV